MAIRCVAGGETLLSEMSADSLGLLDLRILEQGLGLSLPIECLLARGRWLLINAQEPFRDDFLFFNAGVCGLLSGREAPSRILQALDLIAQGELWMPRAILAEAFRRQRARQHVTGNGASGADTPRVAGAARFAGGREQS